MALRQHGLATLARVLHAWCVSWTLRPSPVLEPPENRIGLSFLAVGYGVVLGAVFEQVLINGYGNISSPGWSQLALATSAITFSWIGLFNNRASYPNWRESFINTPLVQFFLSVAILVGYWGLVATTEGIPGTPNVHAKPSALPEVRLIALIFAAYLAWDILELSVLRSPVYKEKLKKCDPDMHCLVEKKLRIQAFWFTVVTAGFFVVAGGTFLIMACDKCRQSAHWVEFFDYAGIAFLLVYRVAQEQFVSDDVDATPRSRIAVEEA
jgi:hypothetical protein